ncbi:type II secretion system F family protein [Botrimarina hoheduenensis]|uniref:Type II secretion system protein F n=1 Tax=Botrimarina hoheduenensis TaxID=2528000 RepID=A0A5C5WFL1_9BACT|nr:type II secretion system F family protein [Botrimarina hoheduenensis]TWT48875.1 Type II secretion system protein F [Botrimarina hoheduenensis]
MRTAAKKTLAPITKALTGKKSKAGTTKNSLGLSWRRATPADRLKKTEVTFFFRNLATLTGNGVPLTKAVGAIAEERTLERRRKMLLAIKKRLESGDTFSHALSCYGATFDKVTLSQIRVGERSGSLCDSLMKIAENREKAGKVKEDIVKKLAYPVVLALVGCCVVMFLLAYVVPVFEDTYRSANVPLPAITKVMIGVGAIAQSYWWAGLLLALGIPLVIKQLRKRDQFALALDRKILQTPLLGPWLRDIALLQLMEVIGSLMEAGFTLAEALQEAADSVSNRAMKRGVTDLHKAVQRGERFSREVERHADLFPPMVSQLIIIGEQTGELTRSTQHIRAHLQEEIQRKSDIAIGVIEPTLTMSMAGAVAVILMAIYLPMFDMISTVS